MTDEEIDVDEYNEALLAQSAAENAWNEQATDVAAYVREFSEDKAFEITDGRIEGGDLPHDIKRKYWGIDGKNFVFSKFDANDVERIDDMRLVLDTALSAYKINKDYFLRRHISILNNKKLSLTEKEEKLAALNAHLQETQSKVYSIYDRINQEIHTFAKTKRAGKGAPGSERAALISKLIFSEKPNAGGDKGVMDRFFGQKRGK